MRPVKFAYISGSATRGIGKKPLQFPEEVVGEARGVKITSEGQRYKTPWGLTAPLRELEVDGVEVLWCPVHNWQKGLSGTASSLQLFFTLHQFGVQYILMDASVGGIKPLKPWDLVIPYDFVALADNLVELSLNVESLPAFIRMAEPLCPDLREIFSEALEESGRGLTGEVYKHGVYISKPLGRFETPAEVQLIHSWSQAAFGQVPIILGQSLGLDAEGARRIGAHAAELCLVANFAEGLSPNKVWWVEEGRSRFYEKSPRVVGPIMLQALKLLVQEPSQSCHCRTYWAEACSSSLL